MGDCTDRYSFTAFGELLEHQGEDPQAYLFAGEMLDPNSGFYYNRARWMDPGAGRFVSVDPFAGSDFEPVTLHRYLYAGADPVGCLDPTGLFTIPNVAVTMLVGGIVNAIIGAAFSNAAPDTGAFWGEFAWNFGAGMLTAPVGGIFAKAFAPVIKASIRPLLSILGRLQPIVLTGGKNALEKLLVRISRFLLNTNKQYPRVAETILGRAMKRVFSFFNPKWDMHHVFVQQAWSRSGSTRQLFTSVAENEGLRRIGNGLWNILPIPRALNQALGRSTLGTQVFATAYYSIIVFGAWHTMQHFLGDGE